MFFFKSFYMHVSKLSVFFVKIDYAMQRNIQIQLGMAWVTLAISHRNVQ